jgi:HEAT repeat protein
MRRIAFLIPFLGTSPVLAEDPPREEPPAESAPADPGALPPEDPEVRLARILAGLKAEEDATRLAATEEATGVEAEELLAPLLRLLKDENRLVRQAAAKALGARASGEGSKKAAKSLAERLKPLSREPEDQEELLVVVQALHDLAQPSSVKALLDDLELETDEDVVEARGSAAANAPCREAVEGLIDLMSRHHRRGRSAPYAKALAYATGEKLGGDPDRWRAWWREHADSFDFEAAAAARAKARAEEAERARRREDRPRRTP